MVGLVQHTTSSQIFEIKLDFLALHILGPHDHTHLPLDRLKKSRKRETTFLADLFAFNVDDLRIDERELARFALFVGNIHDKQTAGVEYLRRSEADASGIVH